MWLHGRILRDDGKEHEQLFFMIGYFRGLYRNNGKEHGDYCINRVYMGAI